MTRPTPLFIAAMIGLVLVIASLWIIATAYNHKQDREAEELLRSQRQHWQPRRLHCNGLITWECVIAYNTGEDNDQEKQVRTD